MHSIPYLAPSIPFLSAYSSTYFLFVPRGIQSRDSAIRDPEGGRDTLVEVTLFRCSQVEEAGMMTVFSIKNRTDG